jgi:predicted CopG family antitoxin
MSRYEKYFNITVKREVYEELKKLADAHGLSVPDFLALVVKTYNLIETLNKTINLLGSSQYITGKILGGENVSHNIKTNVSSVSDVSSSSQDSKKKGDACEWLNQEKIITEGEIVGKYHQDSRDRFFKKWKEVCKAIVIEGSKERTAVLPEVWEEFLRKISSVNSDKETDVKKVLDKNEYKLFKWLKEEGLLVFSVVEKKWMFIQ